MIAIQYDFAFIWPDRNNTWIGTPKSRCKCNFIGGNGKVEGSVVAFKGPCTKEILMVRSVYGELIF